MGKWNYGYCPICESKTIFLKFDDWLRDNYRCLRCMSIPRERALMVVLDEFYPEWRKLKIHESSPGKRGLSRKIMKQCPGYIPSQYYQDAPSGSKVGSSLSENLEQQSFPDHEFDLVITQDVLEHVLHPQKAFSEIERTLKKNGAHIFTTPYYPDQHTKYRVLREGDAMKFLAEPVYHKNPIDKRGSLVTADWGIDLPEIIYQSSKMKTRVISHRNIFNGIDGKFLEVFVSTKN